ncbi:MAG: hypothetical protein MUF10_04390 [Thermoanaerobaculaceae bacterium]|jgi:hypothetical protein|nr:hypothetical protein [Thermoanaerobaculaceae bacterium]
MDKTIALSVFRRLDNRAEGLSDESPRALELHNWRRDALHAAFDADSSIQVLSWGETDSAQPHELVHLTLTAAAAVLRFADVPGLQWLGARLAEKAVDTALGELAQAVVSRLRPRQEAKQMLDFTIVLPDSTSITVDPPDGSANITIRFVGGAVESVVYSK